MFSKTSTTTSPRRLPHDAHRPTERPADRLHTHPGRGNAQVEKWQTFDEEHALGTERTDTRLTIHYAKLDDSTRRLRELVAAESTCCAFVDWNIDESHADLRLVVTGTADELAALSVDGTSR